MSKNVGNVDRVIRIIIGIVLIAFAIRIGFPDTGWNWVGWIGVVPILTAAFGMCPLYSLLGLSTCATRPVRCDPTADKVGYRICPDGYGSP